KDARDRASESQDGSRMDSNLRIFQDDRTGVRRYLYSNVDWGASLGKWGGTLTWTKWDCDGFASQTPDFIKGVEDGRVRWGFNGKHRKDLTADITVSDVQWLLQYLAGSPTSRSASASSQAVPSPMIRLAIPERCDNASKCCSKLRPTRVSPLVMSADYRP